MRIYWFQFLNPQRRFCCHIWDMTSSGVRACPLLPVYVDGSNTSTMQRKRTTKLRTQFQYLSWCYASAVLVGKFCPSVRLSVHYMCTCRPILCQNRRLYCRIPIFCKKAIFHLNFASSDSEISINSENNTTDHTGRTNRLTWHQYLSLKTYSYKKLR